MPAAKCGIFTISVTNILIVATDRLSAFDVVLPTPIPDKGSVLTQMSAFWFRHFENDVPNHVVSTRVEDFPTPAASLSVTSCGDGRCW